MINDNLSDEELLALSLKEPNLFAKLVDRYQEAFLRKARRVIGNSDDSLDIVQDVFVKIYLKAGQFKKQEGASFKSWAYKILLNTCFTYYKKNSNRFSQFETVDNEFFDSVRSEDTEFKKIEIQNYLFSLVSKLPGLLRKTAQLYFIDDIDQDEIAKMEGVSPGVVRTRIHRAKRIIKELKTYAPYE